MNFSRSVMTAVIMTTLASGLFSVTAALGAAPVSSDKKEMIPDLQASCSQLCPGAKNNDDTYICIETKRTSQKNYLEALKKSDPECYQARQKYKAVLGKVTPKTEPYRYG